MRDIKVLIVEDLDIPVQMTGISDAVGSTIFCGVRTIVQSIL